MKANILSIQSPYLLIYNLYYRTQSGFFDDVRVVVVFPGIADLDEAEWWVDLVQKNADMQTALQQVQIKAVTEVNLPLLK